MSRAFQSGLATFPQAIGMMVSVQFTSRLYKYVGPRRMLMIGMMVTASTSALFLLIGLETNLWWVRGIMLLRGVGMAFAIVSSQTATFATIRPQQMGRASSLFSTNRQVSGSVGVALLATVLASRLKFHTGAVSGAQSAALRHASLLAFHDAFFAAMVIALIGIGCTFLIHDEDAAATMGRVPAPRPQIAVAEAMEGLPQPAASGAARVPNPR